VQRLCPILGRPTEVEETEFSRGEWRLVRCRQTGLVFLPDPPPYLALEEDFAWERTHAAEVQRRLADEPVFARLSRVWKGARHRMLPSRNRIAELALGLVRRRRLDEDRLADRPVAALDLGCAGGDRMVDLCDRFQAKGITVVPIGLEISRALATQAAAIFEPRGGRVMQSSAVDGAQRLDDGSLDLVLMSSFLEHEAQPLELLRRLHRKLRPNGAVILKVPNFACWNRAIRGGKWCGFRYPDHVNYFTPATVARLAAEGGYAVLRPSFGDRLPLSDNMYASLVPRQDG
jgi:SAM-dependent methyltransferase